MYFAPPAVDDDDCCACVRKRGTRSAAASDSIDCAIAGRDDIGGVGVGLCHAGSYRCSRTCARVRFRSPDPSSPPRRRVIYGAPTGRANDARALINDLSLSPPLSLTRTHSTLPLLPAACVYLYIIYATRTPPSHRAYIHIYTPMTKLPCFVIFSKRYESLVIYYRRNYPLPLSRSHS